MKHEGYRPPSVAVGLIVLMMSAAGVLTPRAQTPQPDTLNQLLERIQSLEKRLSDQEAQNQKLQQEIQSIRGAQQAPAPAAQPPGKPSMYAVESTSKIQLYGYLKLDAAYDTTATYPGNYPLWVKALPQNGARQPNFHETANQSRFGMNFTLPDSGDVKTTGKVEIDFYGGGPENKANPMLRHAYVNLEWPTHHFSILAGQTSDVISPLVTPTLYYSVAWYQGNIGYRHPQLRFTKEAPVGDHSKWTFQFAVVRPMGRDINGRRTGPDSAQPDVQGRIAYTFAGAAGLPTTFGISGHYGREAYKAFTTTEHTLSAHSSSINLDLTIPFSKKVALTAEAFSGKDLDAFLGGSSEAVNFAKGYGTSSSGGWLALTMKPTTKWTLNLGASADDPLNEDLSIGARSRNRLAFGNGWYAITKAALVGFEVAYMDTEYLGQQNVHALRGQLAIQYNF